ncbi:MAG: hypothetical protein WD691_01040, partial [Acidimicrobiales bacterium]
PVVTEPVAPVAASEPAPAVSLDDRRSRKGRRKKGFDGALTGELKVVTPPAPYEGVRILDRSPAQDELDDDADPELATEPVAASDVPAAVEPAPDVVVAASAEVLPSPEPEPEPVVADDVFARLRAESEAMTDAPTTSDVADVDEPQPVPGSDADSNEAETVATGALDEGGPFAMRAGLVEPLEKEMARALKRALADEQNEVLDTLRREKPKGVEDLLPALELHAARWTGAAVETLRQAASVGSGSGTTVSVDDLAEELALALVGPLRERIDRGFAASDGNLDDIADRVRALYREWRGQRLAETSQHYTAAAYARGAFEAIEPGTKVTWMIDPTVGACPDCDDNVLAGPLDKGESFPTGNACAPAHPGCHCLVVAAPS